MFSFLREIMAPTTHSASAEHQEQDELQTNNDFEEIEHSMEEFTGAADDEDVTTDSAPPTPELKGFKITDNERSKKYGLGASSLQMLKNKAKLKFPVSITMKNLPLQTYLLCIYIFHP